VDLPAAPLIVTATLDPATFAVVDALRRLHFPPDRNHLSAHVTLFHCLPGEHESSIADLLSATAAATPPLPLALPSVRSLGRGVAVEIRCGGLANVHARLAHAWLDWLTPQDRHGFRPHVTIQNKVAPAAARDLLDHLRPTWQPLTGHATGLALSRYHGGPWEPVATFPFVAPQP
jgi:2'-5' RNA ligase